MGDVLMHVALSSLEQGYSNTCMIPIQAAACHERLGLTKFLQYFT